MGSQERIQTALGSSVADFVAVYPAPVLVALEILGGDLQRPVTDRATRRTGRFDRSTRGRPSLVAPTHNFIDPAEADGASDAVMLERRAVPRAVVFDLRKRSPGSPGPISIGRHPDNDVLINDFAISSRHAELLFADRDGWFGLNELGSTNGSAVGATELVPGHPIWFPTRTRVTLGRMVFYVLTPHDCYVYLRHLAGQPSEACGV